jgi:hypothetical protein
MHLSCTRCGCDELAVLGGSDLGLLLGGLQLAEILLRRRIASSEAVRSVARFRPVSDSVRG